ncbi:MAG TPA: hypothetical protein VK083_05745 [Nocardia sp.]|uniref:zf-HC2 domain-containing protein n=1 Tax=Nocardia TaxID=1817 RepID=UPI002453C514|nr:MULTISPECIES: hypothetical protein [Nocardia]HLS76272.1 hypothetical protein [Nocardia sp.]
MSGESSTPGNARGTGRPPQSRSPQGRSAQGRPEQEGSPHGNRPRFAPTEHLASEAVVAYVDGELRMNAYLRAAQHLAQCPECEAEVEAQQQARIALRQSGPIAIPRGLHDSLSRIPLAELPGQGGKPDATAPGRGNARNEAVFGFLPDSFTATRWAAWWRK